MPIIKLMEFLNKIENLINSLLEKLSQLIINYFYKLMPAKVLVFGRKIIKGYTFLISTLKNSPQLIKKGIIFLISYVKRLIKEYDFKALITGICTDALKKYKEQKANGPKSFSKLKNILLTPFLLMTDWLKGLSTSQTLLLLGFSAASILASVNMIFSSQRLLGRHAGRAPASVEEIPYERPGYYKQETRHMTITNFRLPVYVADVNELRSVDIDFIATMSNRNIKRFLEINEFQLRDHLIGALEPIIASFPLEEEGKEIISIKLAQEINEFLKRHQQDGRVEILEITYILAN